jgi:hypothetical protein
MKLDNMRCAFMFETERAIPRNTFLFFCIILMDKNIILKLNMHVSTTNTKRVG